MKWVVVAILVCIVPYTWITISYRKPGPAFEPYADSKNRANVVRLLDAGYQRFTIPAIRPADPSRSQPAGPAAGVTEMPGGLPVSLSQTLVEIPLMPERILTVTAPDAATADAPYVFQFTCTVPDTREQLAGAELYLRERELTLIPTFERIPGDLHARSRESIVLIEIPAGTLTPGRHDATLIGARGSLRWSFDVNP